MAWSWNALDLIGLGSVILRGTSSPIIERLPPGAMLFRPPTLFRPLGARLLREAPPPTLFLLPDVAIDWRFCTHTTAQTSSPPPQVDRNPSVYPSLSDCQRWQGSPSGQPYISSTSIRGGGGGGVWEGYPDMAVGPIGARTLAEGMTLIRLFTSFASSALIRRLLAIPPNPERHTLPHQQCNVLLHTYHLPSTALQLLCSSYRPRLPLPPLL